MSFKTEDGKTKYESVSWNTVACSNRQMDKLIGKTDYENTHRPEENSYHVIN